MRMKRNDTKPDLVITLTDNNVPIDLTAATSVRVIATHRGQLAFDDTSPTLDRPAGKVTHMWLATETALSGRIWFEVEVTWSGGAVQTFPTRGYLYADVVDDLG